MDTHGPPDHNPKTRLGIAKVPLHLVPPSAKHYLALALEDGAAKYGASNWRDETISSSVYKAAAERHMDAWWDGEDNAEDSGVHHIAHAMACMALILDAQSIGKLNDNRPTKGAASRLQAEYATNKESANGSSPPTGQKVQRGLGRLVDGKVEWFDHTELSDTEFARTYWGNDGEVRDEGDNGGPISWYGDVTIEDLEDANDWCPFFGHLSPDDGLSPYGTGEPSPKPFVYDPCKYEHWNQRWEEREEGTGRLIENALAGTRLARDKREEYFDWHFNGWVSRSAECSSDGKEDDSSPRVAIDVGSDGVEHAEHAARAAIREGNEGGYDFLGLGWMSPRPVFTG